MYASVEVDFTITEERKAAVVAVSIDDLSYSQVITCPPVDEHGNPLEFSKGSHRVRVDLGKIELNSGKYVFSARRMLPLKIARADEGA